MEYLCAIATNPTLLILSSWSTNIWPSGRITFQFSIYVLLFDIKVLPIPETFNNKFMAFSALVNVFNVILKVSACTMIKQIKKSYL